MREARRAGSMEARKTACRGSYQRHTELHSSAAGSSSALTNAPFPDRCGRFCEGEMARCLRSRLALMARSVAHDLVAIRSVQRRERPDKKAATDKIRRLISRPAPRFAANKIRRREREKIFAHSLIQRRIKRWDFSTIPQHITRKDTTRSDEKKMPPAICVRGRHRDFFRARVFGAASATSATCAFRPGA